MLTYYARILLMDLTYGRIVGLHTGCEFVTAKAMHCMQWHLSQSLRTSGCCCCTLWVVYVSMTRPLLQTTRRSGNSS